MLVVPSSGVEQYMLASRALTRATRNYALKLNFAPIRLSHTPVKIEPRTIGDIIRLKEHRIFTINQQSTLLDAIRHFVTQSLGSLLAVSDTGEITGVLTARDVLRIMYKNNYGEALALKIQDVMTKKEKMVYCTSKETVSKILGLMYQVKIRNIPVIDDGEVSGIITLKDLADSAFSAYEGGKKGFISNVTGRMGIAPGTRLNAYLARTAAAVGSHGILDMPQLGADIAAYALPHPFKRSGTVANTRRDYGADELCYDMSLCEDAHFAIQTSTPESHMGGHVYLCVADGVGSWREYGVDPRNFSHALVEHAKNRIHALDGSFPAPLHPLDIMIDAWTATVDAKVIGSSTLCLASLDTKANQLEYSNIGDCGLMVVRHIDSERAGYMRNRQQPRHLRINDMKIAYLSQQQLRSFNLPFQLGYADGVPDFRGKFESPADADSGVLYDEILLTINLSAYIL